MKNSFQYLVLALIVLVLGATLEELLPKFLGVGFPILLAVTHHASSRRTPIAAVWVALMAGGMTDALSALPMMTSASFFLLMAIVILYVPLLRPAMYMVYPLYQVWLSLWLPGVGGEVFARILIAVPVGALTSWLVGSFLTWLEERSAIDEVE